MTPAEFDARVNDLLDERRDPLDDAACLAFLAEHPERIDELASLRERLAALPVVAIGAPARRRGRVAGTTVGLALAAAAAAIVWIVRPGAATDVAAPPGRVLAAASVPLPSYPDGVAGARARSVLLARPDARLETFSRW